MRPGDRKNCEACGKPMIGALTRDGKVAPIEADPDERGNVLVFQDRDDDGERVLACRTFAGFALDEMREQGVPLRLNHFAYCPERERFKGGARG